MNHYEWNQMPAEQLSPQVSRKAIHSGNMTVARLELLKDAAVAEHSHHNEQITMVERGALKFAIDGGEKVVRAGETLVIPPNAVHGVVALEDSVIFDVFAPSRDDWPR
ncbi:MAG TPA: cupin domain-containing protein [Bryobacteraceae bacterium]|jgi:quercetin dioxygenase-like cupin family protein|nr:cupin domain-containing protein [Bryobacteraceae bacterium]